MDGGTHNDEHEQLPNKNGKLLTLLLSSGGDVSVKLITLVLVVVSGGSNLFATKSLSDQERVDRDRAVREIHELHEEVDDIVRRQKDVIYMVEDIQRKLNK